jgi:hypothetical protein
MRPIPLAIFAAVSAFGIAHAQGHSSQSHGRGGRESAPRPAYYAPRGGSVPREAYGAGHPMAPPPYYVPPAPAAPPRMNSLGANWREQQDEARQGVRQGQMAPLGQVIQGLRQRTPGRQLDVGIEYMGPRAVYRVRWMTVHGRRVDYIVDAASGAILSAH